MKPRPADKLQANQARCLSVTTPPQWLVAQSLTFYLRCIDLWRERRGEVHDPKTFNKKKALLTKHNVRLLQQHAAHEVDAAVTSGYQVLKELFSLRSLCICSGHEDPRSSRESVVNWVFPQHHFDNRKIGLG